MLRWHRIAGAGTKLGEYLGSMPTTFVLPSGSEEFLYCFQQAAGLAPPLPQVLSSCPVAPCAWHPCA